MLSQERMWWAKDLSSVETRVLFGAGCFLSSLQFGVRLSLFAEAEALADWIHKLGGSIIPEG